MSSQPADARSPLPPLELTPAPYLKAPDSTARIMWTVVVTLVPIVLASAYFFGLSALLVIAAAAVGAVGTEQLFGARGAIGDGSALITGLLLGLTLPAGFPLWMAVIGGIFAIGFGKLIFGGLGQNVFNPALLGRAFLQAAFPVAITTWPKLHAQTATLLRANLAFPFTHPAGIDVVTSATPLGLMKFQHEGTPVMHLLLGNTGGSLGETAALLILICGGYLALKGYLNWRIPVAVFASVAALSALLHGLSPQHYPGPLFMLLSGGLVLGAVYMATDMVTSPVTNNGAWIFGIGIGILVVVIRIWGGLPEGVMYSILLMNALVPFINRATRPRVFGTARRGSEAS